MHFAERHLRRLGELRQCDSLESQRAKRPIAFEFGVMQTLGGPAERIETVPGGHFFSLSEIESITAT